MSKPTQINSQFFYHDSDMRNDIKIKALRRRFSHMGYAVWCCLLEMMTDADGLAIDFSDISQELIAADLDVDVQQLKDIVAYCQQIGLFQMTETGSLFSKAHQERLSYFIDQKTARAEARREAGRLGGLRSAENRRQRETASKSEALLEVAKPMLEANDSIGNLSKVKESKVKKNKEEDNSIEYPYQDIMRLWNETCLSLPKIRQLNDDRRNKIRCRLNEWGKTLDEMMTQAREIISRCASSPFLCGENNQGWTASFDWLFENSKNWVKVLEGNYDRNRGSQRQHTAQGGQRLGVGEYIEQGTGRRTYGTGKAEIPLSAPPRPSERHSWDSQSQQWILI